jgi:hypothetical protein
VVSRGAKHLNSYDATLYSQAAKITDAELAALSLESHDVPEKRKAAVSA